MNPPPVTSPSLNVAVARYSPAAMGPEEMPIRTGATPVSAEPSPKKAEAVMDAPLMMFPLGPVAVKATLVMPTAPVKVAPARLALRARAGVMVERSTAVVGTGPTMVVALPTEVTGPVRLALVVTFPAVRDGAVPVSPELLPKKPEAVDDPMVVMLPAVMPYVTASPFAAVTLTLALCKV